MEFKTADRRPWTVDRESWTVDCGLKTEDFLYLHMLKTLRISNYAIINEAEISFSGSMNIITGETGAGKSILLGALSLVLGDRADSRVLFNREKKCIVEAVFNIRDYHLQSFFEEEEIDYEDETIIRRELSDSGKSRAFINDSPVNLNVLQGLADKLITIHSQHETLALGNSRFQLMVIDALAGNDKSLEDYKKLFQSWKQISKQLTEAENLFAKANTEKDFNECQLNELNKIEFDEIDQEVLENELQQLNHAEEIKRNLIEGADQLENGQQTIIENIRSVIQLIRSIAKYNPEFESYVDRLETASVEIKDIARDLSDRGDRIIADPVRAEEVQNLLSTIYKLQKKHQCNSVEELVALKNKLNTQSAAFESSEEEIEKLNKEKNKLHISLLVAAKKISDKRTAVFPHLESSVKKLLGEVGMKDAALKVHHNYDPEKHLTDSGADTVQYLFSANKGSALQDISKVASGGELSRLMLCIKSLLANTVALPTLIFDEIDTGISGETANKVGNILSGLAEKHQLIAITHLPQIAARGQHHLFVYKETDNKTTYTKIRQLKNDERITEIAKMLSGENPTKAALENAKELIK